MASSNNMIYTRVCDDCGKVMHNVGRRTERCPECRAVHIRVKALEASYRERTEQLIRQQEERAEAIHQGLVDDNERFTASAGTYGKGRTKEKAARRCANTDRLQGLMDFTGHINPKITHFRRFYKMEKNYVEIQGRFSSDGMFVGGNYVPEVIDKLMNDVYYTLGQAGSLYRLRVTVEVEDLGAEVKFGKPASETQHSPAPQRLTAGKLIPAPDISPAAIDPAPEVAV